MTGEEVNPREMDIECFQNVYLQSLLSISHPVNFRWYFVTLQFSAIFSSDRQDHQHSQPDLAI